MNEIEQFIDMKLDHEEGVHSARGYLLTLNALRSMRLAVLTVQDGLRKGSLVWASGTDTNILRAMVDEAVEHSERRVM